VKRLAPVVFALAALLAAGCVERKMLVRSDPPGAAVTLNRVQTPEGVTPLEVPFDHYGTWHLALRREGYRDYEGAADLSAPWWGYTPFDLFTDLLWPFTIEDHREVAVTLTPLPEPRPLEEIRARHAEVISRGEQMRKEVTEGEPSEVR
jgi:hypothetical protein